MSIFLALTFMVGMAITTVNAHPQYRRECRNVQNNYGNVVRRCRNYRLQHNHGRRGSFYRRHRNASNIAIGTAGGAIIGGLLRGRKGALVGAGVGAAGSTVYTYKVKPKRRRY